MVIQNVPEDEWTRELIPALVGRPREAYAEMDPHADYHEVKSAMLAWFDIIPRIKLRRTPVSAKG